MTSSLSIVGPCFKNQYLLYSQCLDKCPGNFFASTRNVTYPTQNGTSLTYTANTCEQCHVNCSLCFGKEQDECSSCAKGFSLNNSTCIPAGKSAQRKYLGIVIVAVCVCVIIVAVIFLLFHLHSHRYCDSSPHYSNLTEDGGLSSEPGISKQRLLDSLSDSSDEDEYYTQSKVFLDVTNGDMAQFSPIRVNGYRQSYL